jgi:hypothetical protein
MSKSHAAEVQQLTARIIELEDALRSVLNQPETAEAYDAMMQRVIDALGNNTQPEQQGCRSRAGQ